MGLFETMGDELKYKAYQMKAQLLLSFYQSTERRRRAIFKRKE